MKNATTTTAAPQTSKAKALKTAKAQKTVSVKKVLTPKITYLAEGITGKALQSAKIDTNKAHKVDAGSFSYCKNRVLQFNAGFLEGFAAYNEADITPKNLLPLRSEKEAARPNFSVWLIMQLISRYYKKA
jgi:hypothetical protein